MASEPENLVLKPPASWSPKSKADFPKQPPHIQQAVAKRAAEMSRSLAGRDMNENRKVKPGKIVLRPPKSWPPEARRDYSKMPAHMQRDIAEDEAAFNVLVPRAHAVRRLADALMTRPGAEKRSDSLMGLRTTLTGMNHERGNLAE